MKKSTNVLVIFTSLLCPFQCFAKHRVEVNAHVEEPLMMMITDMAIEVNRPFLSHGHAEGGKSIPCNAFFNSQCNENNRCVDNKDESKGCKSFHDDDCHCSDSDTGEKCQEFDHSRCMGRCVKNEEESAMCDSISYADCHCSPDGGGQVKCSSFNDKKCNQNNRCVDNKDETKGCTSMHIEDCHCSEKDTGAKCQQFDDSRCTGTCVKDEDESTKCDSISYADCHCSSHGGGQVKCSSFNDKKCNQHNRCVDNKDETKGCSSMNIEDCHCSEKDSGAKCRKWDATRCIEGTKCIDDKDPSKSCNTINYSKCHCSTKESRFTAEETLI